jgi:hypothetical protein
VVVEAMIGTAQFTCVCCGTKLPGTRQELIAARAATITGAGQTFFHCPHPRHSHEEIQKMIHATPTFSTGSKYREGIID